MSDLARWELRGPVWTLQTQFAEWNPETGDWRPLRNRFVATFRSDGQLSEIEHHNPDGSVPREVRLYDEAGRLTENQWWSNDILTRRVVHTYSLAPEWLLGPAMDANVPTDEQASLMDLLKTVFEDHTFSHATSSGARSRITRNERPGRSSDACL